MFKKVRRVKNEISAEEARALLRNNRRGALAVNGDGGYPYAVPIDFYYDEDENRIYFHSAKAGHKIDSMRSNGKVCFATWDDGVLEDGDWAYHVSSCIVFGRAKLIEDRGLTAEKIRKFALKYYPSEKEADAEIKKSLGAVQLVAIDIEHVSGKRVHEK